MRSSRTAIMLKAAGLLWSFAAPAVVQAQVIYVDTNAGGANSGANWTDAYPDLQDALVVATSGDEIWVAEGLYIPTSGTDRTISYVMPNGVRLYGGFDGTESSRDERDWTAHETILSGDIGVKSDSTDNSFHVVQAISVDALTVLDGFSIMLGTGGGAAYPDDRGAGLLIIGGGPVVRNSYFVRNTIGLPIGQGDKYGAGIYSEDASPVIEDCRFEDNVANLGGGAYFARSVPVLRRDTLLRNDASALVFDDASTGEIEDVVIEDGETTGVSIIGSSPHFVRTTIRNNVVGSGGDGGGMRISSTDGEERATPIFEDCLFEGNTAGSDGGAVFMIGDVSALFIRTTFRDNRAIDGVGGALRVLPEATFLFCHFERNRAAGNGGAVAAQGTVTIIGSTFVGNRVTFAPSGGGALALIFSPLPGQTRTIANTLFAGNKGPHGGAVIAFGAEDTRLINVTFAGNEGTTAGGAVAAFDSGALEIQNAVFWGNEAPLDNEIHIASGVGPTVERAIVAGGYPSGTDILDQDPLFVRNPDPGPDGNWGTDDDDYGDLRLRRGSPGVDYGLQSFLPPDTWDLDGDGDTTEPLPIDLNGDVRVQAAEVDLGAYEGAVIVANEPEVPEPSEFSLKVYPNPVIGYLTVETEAEEITIVDVLGRVVMRMQPTQPVNISDLAPGVYVVRAGNRSRLITIRR